MDSYSFTYSGLSVTIRKECLEWISDTGMRAACAEILRLAEESEARRVYIESFEPQAVATGEENRRLREQLISAIKSWKRFAQEQFREKEEAERALRRVPIRRTAKLLALLDSEEPPQSLIAALREWRGDGNPVYAVSPQAIWRWLREQVAMAEHQVPPVGPVG